MNFWGNNLPNVAIPHTDVDHSLDKKIVVVRLVKPVTFYNMISPNKILPSQLNYFNISITGCETVVN